MDTTNDYRSKRNQMFGQFPMGFASIRKVNSDQNVSRIVIINESRVHHYEPKSKRQITEWKQPGSLTKKNFKTSPSAGKAMQTLFWDEKGPKLDDYLDRGTILDKTR
ncbi:hypothetical protein NPIL_426741 [Nephila pilipes]|uniref:Uncharacterized protein n=1 Tax=Nephila pilipes TaxID=299642 RepID=A0A8X6QAK0_NEPPI|nr:hypothetical protein NPIL_426741 [Nephila pilipes]